MICGGELMVTGIDSFKEWFKGCEEQYAIIGGTACDILMTEEGLDFRATKDLDLVLIIEAVLMQALEGRFWNYVNKQDMNIVIKAQEFLNSIVLVIRFQNNIQQ